MLSDLLKALRVCNRDKEALQQKFNAYHLSCDRYIKDRESKLEAMRTENAQISADFDQYRQLYNEEKAGHEALLAKHNAFLVQYELYQQAN